MAAATRSMQMSAGLWVAGFLLILVQYLWRPGEDVHGLLLFVPLILSLASFASSLVLGVVRGTRLYRAAMILGLIGLITIAAGITVPFDRNPSPRPSPTRNEIVLSAGVVLSLLAGVVGAVAIARRRRQEDLGR